MKLLNNYNVLVDRTKLRVALQGARQKNPIFLLNKLIALVFSKEELANSCGLGIHTTSAKSAISKQSIPKLPLDSYKVAACNGIMNKSLDIWPLLTKFRGQVWGNVLAWVDCQQSLTFAQNSIMKNERGIREARREATTRRLHYLQLATLHITLVTEKIAKSHACFFVNSHFDEKTLMVLLVKFFSPTKKH